MHDCKLFISLSNLIPPAYIPAPMKRGLEKLYRRYNRREFVSPDPLQFLYDYENGRDREIVGIVASSLAYGNVKQILRSVSIVLGVLGDSPHGYLMKSSETVIKKDFRGFKHRFTTGADLANLLIAVKKNVTEYGSLKASFLKGFSEGDQNVVSALSKFAKLLDPKKNGFLIPSPERSSACKRLNLFLRWMVRSDSVDPGGWNEVDKSKLIVPLDTHMHNIALQLGLTKRKQGNLKTAEEITSGFAKISPNDPVKYDFCLTRLGIRDDLDIESALKQIK